MENATSAQLKAGLARAGISTKLARHHRMRNRASIEIRAQLRNLPSQPVEHRRPGGLRRLLSGFRPPPVVENDHCVTRPAMTVTGHFRAPESSRKQPGSAYDYLASR